MTRARAVRRALVPAAGVLLLLLGLLLGAAAPASAHPLNTSAVLLDIGTDQVAATVELPLDQLSVAWDQVLTAGNVTDPTTLTALRGYVQRDLWATDAAGRAWTTTVTGGRVTEVDGVDQLVLDATLTPSSGPVGDFVLHDEAVLDKLVSHRIFVSGRIGDEGGYTTIAMLSWQQQSVPVASVTPPASTGFGAAVHLGIDHIRGGSDHLLFLIMLLLPAPLVTRGRRWRRRDDLRSGAVRVVHVVSAFAVGHSITLALGALGLVHLPTRLVESGIALSVLVSAVHAIRPLVRRGEVAIGVTFGLLHGLSFAALIGELELSRSSLLTTLLGFNLGIELTQLLVVALVMPSLLLLSRTSLYAPLRITLAGTGAVLAGAWLAERIGILTSNPLAPTAELVVQDPLALAGGLAALALLTAAARPRSVCSSTVRGSEPARPPLQVLEHRRGRRDVGDRAGLARPSS